MGLYDLLANKMGGGDSGSSDNPNFWLPNFFSQYGSDFVYMALSPPSPVSTVDPSLPGIVGRLIFTGPRP